MKIVGRHSKRYEAIWLLVSKTKLNVFATVHTCHRRRTFFVFSFCQLQCRQRGEGESNSWKHGGFSVPVAVERVQWMTYIISGSATQPQAMAVMPTESYIFYGKSGNLLWYPVKSLCYISSAIWFRQGSFKLVLLAIHDSQTQWFDFLTKFHWLSSP